MPMFEGGSQATRQRGSQFTQPGKTGREVYDLVTRVLLGNLMQPQETDIPVPLQQAVSGYQDIMSKLLSLAYGPPQGLGARLSGGAGAAPATESTPVPTSVASGASWLPTGFGNGGGTAAPAAAPFGLQTREQLGLSKPSIVANPEYLPKESDVLAHIPPMRTTEPYRNQQRQERRLDRLQGRRETAAAAGREQKTAKLDRKIARTTRRLEENYV